MSKNSDEMNAVLIQDLTSAQPHKEKNEAETGSKVDAVDRSQSAKDRCNACRGSGRNDRPDASVSVLIDAPERTGELALPASAHGAEPSDAEIAEPVAWFAFGDSNGPVPLELYGWDEKSCKHAVLTYARAGNWKGTVEGYLLDQGWTLRPVYLGAPTPPAAVPAFTYSSTQATECAGCGQRKHTPLRVDAMGGYVRLTCIDTRLEELLNAAQAAKAGAVPEGFKLVPVIPTEEMFVDGMEADCTGLSSVDDEGHVHSIWNAMLAAAPSQPAPAQPDAARLEKIRQAIRDYHYALDKRMHGGVAQSGAYRAIESAMEMQWDQGAEAGARAAQAVAKGGA